MPSMPLPNGPLGDFTSASDPISGFVYGDLFSADAPPTSRVSSDNLSELSRIPRREQTDPSQPSSSASSPPSGPTSNASRKRVRPKIALAPGQPPTARGNDRIRVYVACHECRARKIRCDGAKPMCVQCQKRPSDTGACTYDAAPNRRGNDRRGRGTSRATPGAKAGKRRRTVIEEPSPAPPTSETTTESHPLSDIDDPIPHTPPNEVSSSEQAEVEAGDDLFDFQLDDVFEYDPFAFDPNNPELFLAPTSHSVSPPSSAQEQERAEEDESIPSRPGVQFARETWWEALLMFYTSDGDSNSVISLTAEQRSGALRLIVSDLRALFHSSASWMSFIHLPRFFETLLNPVRRADMQPSLLLAALALGTLTQSSEIEKGEKGRQRALQLLDMAHSALQSSLATGWVDIGLAQAGWMVMYFELNSHPLQSWPRSNSAMSLLDSLVRLFSLTTLDSNFARLEGTGSPPLISSGHGFAHQPIANVSGVAMPVQNVSVFAEPVDPLSGASFSAPQLGSGPGGLLQSQYSVQNHFSPQPNTHAFDPQVQNPFHMSNVSPNHPIYPHISPSPTTPTATGSITGGYHPHPHAHKTQPAQAAHEEGPCDCARFSLGENWPSVRQLAPAWASTLMWPVGLSEAEFRKEECRRLVWGSVAMVANLNAYASLSPQGIEHTGKLFVKESESFSLLTPSEMLARSGTLIVADDVWSLSLRSMLLLHSCLRARASTTMTGAQRAEFAVRAWLEIDDLERRLSRHKCGMASNFGFQSTEMLFSLRICVSYEFQRFIPQITTNGNSLFYRDKAEHWLRHLDSAIDFLYNGLRKGPSRGGQDLDHRKSFFVFWYMSGIKKCLVLWEADPTLDLALKVGCRAAEHLEHLLLYWPSSRVRLIWQNMRFELVQACIQAGVPPPARSIPRPIPRNAAAGAAAATPPGKAPAPAAV
ncbi:hypothetical protein C8Q78DRAFT_1162108 [Trametes maxima]|nr:hypothetical protein C8Q78DRAFT_1162108 [Trametes maxima]